MEPSSVLEDLSTSCAGWREAASFSEESEVETTITLAPFAKSLSTIYKAWWGKNRLPDIYRVAMTYRLGNTARTSHDNRLTSVGGHSADDYGEIKMGSMVVGEQVECQALGAPSAGGTARSS
jgi:hypothetical protein